MKQGEIYEQPSEKYQIEEYILSLRFQDEPDWNQNIIRDTTML